MRSDDGLRLTTLGQVAQAVTNLNRAVEFYGETLGGALVARFDPPGLAFFDCGGVWLLLDGGAALEHRGSVLYFRVDDIEGACAELRSRGVAFDGEPHMIFRDDEGVFGTAGVETWMAFFKDPDGNTLGIMSEVAP